MARARPVRKSLHAGRPLCLNRRDDAVTDNPARERAYLQRLRSTKIKVLRSMYASESDDIQVWEIEQKDLPRLSQIQGFLGGTPSRDRKGYSLVEILTGSDAD